MSFNDLLKSHLFTLGNLQYQKDSFVKGSQCLCWASLAEASPHVSKKDRLVTVPGGGHSVCNPGNLRSILLVWPGVCKHEAPNCCQLRCISKTPPRGSLIIHYQQHVKPRIGLCGATGGYDEYGQPLPSLDFCWSRQVRFQLAPYNMLWSKFKVSNSRSTFPAECAVNCVGLDLQTVRIHTCSRFQNGSIHQLLWVPSNWKN